MPLVYYVPEYERDAEQTPLDAERLLRLLGVTGKLSGFRYAVYMVEQVRDQPDNVLLITKRLYKQTADHFNTTSSCVDQFSVHRHDGRLPAKLIFAEKGGALPPFSFYPCGNVAQFETYFDTVAIRHRRIKGCVCAGWRQPVFTVHKQ